MGLAAGSIACQGFELSEGQDWGLKGCGRVLEKGSTRF